MIPLDSNSLASNYIIKWHHGGIAWFIRGVKPDRSFYGDYTKRSGGPRIKGNIKGRLSEEDYERIIALAKQIKSESSSETFEKSGWNGMLAEGMLNNSSVIFKYYESSESTKANELFIEIIHIIQKYV